MEMIFLYATATFKTVLVSIARKVHTNRTNLFYSLVVWLI